MRILIVDDHHLIRKGLALTIRELDSDCEIAAAKDFTEAMAAVDRSAPFDLVLLDLGLPGMQGLTALSEMRSRYPALPVVVVSAHADRTSVIQALNLGAMGYIPKSTPDDDSMIDALKTIISGQIYLPADVLRRGDSGRAGPGVAGTSPLGRIDLVRSGRPNHGLTPAQLSVLKLLLRGLSNKLICRQLDLAESTVKTHLRAIFTALEVDNRTQAVIAASELGIGVGPERD